MDTQPFSLQSPEAIAKEYGGNKQAIARAAQMGLVDPTAAVLAGMFIDRMRGAAAQEQAPQQTVAQAVLEPQPQMQPQMAQMPMAQEMPVQPMAGGGLADLPVDDSMFPSEYAGGGIVAFSAGNQVRTDPYRAYIPGRGAYRLSPEDEERLVREGRREFVKPTFSEALGQMRSMFVDPTVEYLSTDPIKQTLLGDSVAASPAPFTPVGVPAGGPMTAADLRRLEAERGDAYLTGPGLTPEQSAANVAAARQAPEAAGQAAAAPAGFNVEDIIARSGRMARGLIPEETAAVPTIAQANLQTEEELRVAGFDPDLIKKQRAELETEKAGLAEDRKTAMNMRLIEAGLGIMAGESANAFANIGKGATPALQGLSKDIKELKTAERAYNQAQRDLDKKQNEFALGKAGMNRSVVEKAQQRVDDRAKEIRDLQGGLAKTMLAGEIQKDIAKASLGGRITDFDKQWARYEAEAKAKGETPSFSGFQRSLIGARGTITYKDAFEIAAKADPYASPEEMEARARQILASQERYSGGATGGRYQEGQTAKDKTGKPIVYRNGQWVYQ